MSINGPATWNDTVMLGNRIAMNPVNIPAWQMLPDRTMRNWADMTSYTNYNKPNMTPLESFLASNITNPNHISQWDPMLFTLGCPQLRQNNMMTNPFLTQLGIQQACNYGYQRAMATRANQVNSMIQRMAGALAALESQLEELIENDQLTDKQKEKLEAKLEEVRNLKEKIYDAIRNQASYEEFQMLGAELLNLQQSVSKLIQKITEQVRTSGNDDGDDVDGSDDGSDDDEDNENVNADYDRNGRPTSLGAVPSNSDLELIVSQIFASVDINGTDEDTLKANIAKLDAGNIIEVIKKWENGYGQHTATGNDGFFARIFDDVDDDFQREIIPFMLDALSKRAEALGIYDEISALVGSVNRGLTRTNWCGMTWHDDHQLANDLMAIYDKIVAKEKANAAEYGKESDKAKADKQQKSDDEAKEAKATFLDDMREIWEDDELEISDKVKYKDGKFTVRIQGEEYTARTFKALVKKIENDDLDPKKYLAKQKVNVQA